MYMIRFIDFNGTKREFLSSECELRNAVNNFYLDECPQHISSVSEVRPCDETCKFCGTEADD